MAMMKSICVYCGSRTGNLNVYANAARQLAREMVNDNIALVYGGGRVGLMGIIADEVLRLGGKVTGIIPRYLMEKEVGHEGLTQLYVVKNMHERKALMAELSDGFVAMPGGLGTLDELFEILTWNTLGLHKKPIGLLNVDGFYDKLMYLVNYLVEQGFADEENARLLLLSSHPEELVSKLRLFSSVDENKPATHARFFV